MKRKQGISLIVLVITIIVMIILAASVVLTLSNSGIINKANEGVLKNDIGAFKTKIDIEYTKLLEKYNYETSKIKEADLVEMIENNGWELQKINKKKIELDLLGEDGKVVENIIMIPLQSTEYTIKLTEKDYRYFVNINGKYYEIDLLQTGIKFNDEIINIDKIENNVETKLKTNAKLFDVYIDSKLVEGEQLVNGGEKLKIVAKRKNGMERIGVQSEDGNKEINVKIIVNAETIAKNPEVLYGKTIVGYECEASEGVDKWLIYHSDGNNTFIRVNTAITTNYFPSDVPVYGNNSRVINSKSLISDDCTGLPAIKQNEIAMKWINILPDEKYNTSEDLLGMETLLNTAKWSHFVGEGAIWCFGASTVKMFIDAWNNLNSENQLEYRGSSDGARYLEFKFKNDTNEESWSNYISFYNQNTNKNWLGHFGQYVSYDWETHALAYPLWCNGSSWTRTFTHIDYRSTINQNGYTKYGVCLHPVVALDQRCEFELQDDDTYKLIVK